MSAGQATIAREWPRSWGGVPGFEVPGWREAFGILAGVTDRSHDFELPPSGVAPAFGKLLDAVGPGFDEIAVSRQVHGKAIARQDKSRPGVRCLESYDGHVTTDTGVLLAVTVADCIPVYLADPARGIVALLHAGWRGVALGILDDAIGALSSLGNGSVGDIVMHCGVGICGDCYEVGPEVIRSVIGTREVARRALDLRAVLVERGTALGVSRVSVSGWCTAHEHERFHSHRASGGQDGRQVAFIGRPSP